MINQKNEEKARGIRAAEDERKKVRLFPLSIFNE
jgi:hypothetical protein